VTGAVATRNSKQWATKNEEAIMTGVNLRELDREAFTDHVAAYHQSFGRDFWQLLWAAAAELASGRSVEPEQLASVAHLPLDRMVAIARHTWEWDPSGERLVGAGLTSIETPYRVDIDNRIMWTYCAPDTLELPVILGKPVRTQSSCAATGDPIHVHATPSGVETVDPPTTVVSFPDAPFGDLANVRQTGCALSSFYRDADAAAGWLAANPHGRLATVPDAFEVLRVSMLRIKESFDKPAN
jgi:alkylmercury lyase